MPNLELKRKERLSSFRKIALGTWSSAHEASAFGGVDLPMDEAMRFLEEFRARTGKKLTVTHLVTKAVALALKAVPDANAVLRFGRIFLRERVSIFHAVLVEEDGEFGLHGASVHDADAKPLAQICDELSQEVSRVRAGQDPVYEESKRAFAKMPQWMVGPLLRLVSFLSIDLNLDLSKNGMPKDRFGSVMISNLGSLDMEPPITPLVPYAKVPIAMVLGAVREAPVVREGRIEVGKVMRVTATIDHRVIDGFHVARLLAILKDCLQHPQERLAP